MIQMYDALETKLLSRLLENATFDLYETRGNSNQIVAGLCVNVT